MRSPGFGYIYIQDFTGDDRLVRIATLDIEDIRDQYSPKKEPCYIRTNDGFCQSGWTSGESSAAILEKIAVHDKKYLGAFRDYAARNSIILMRGELW